MAEEDPIKKLEAYHSDVRARTSRLRKKGVDTRMAELRLMNVKSKIDYARASMDKRDMEKVMEILNKVEGELEEASSRFEGEKQKSTLTVLSDEEIEKLPPEEIIKEEPGKKKKLLDHLKGLGF